MLYIAALFFLFLLIANYYTKKSILNVTGFLFIWYLSSIISCIIIDFNGPYLYIYNVNAILYYILAVGLFTVPFLHLDESQFETIYSPYHNRVIILIWFIIVVNLVSLLYSLTNAIMGMSGDLQLNRLTVVTGGGTHFYLYISLLRGTYFVAITLFFFSIINRYSIILTFLLLLSSFSSVTFYLSQTGRTGALFWVCIFVFNYLLFKKHLTSYQKISISCIGLLVSTLLGFIFIAITQFRFGSGCQYSTFLSIVDYFGKGIRNFDTFYTTDYTNYFYGKFCFPLFWGVIERLGVLHYDYHLLLQQTKQFLPLSWSTFSSLLRELWYDFGSIGTIISGVVFYFCVLRSSKADRQGILLSKIFILSFLFQISCFGVFSFILPSPANNFVVIYLIAVHFFLKGRKVGNA